MKYLWITLGLFLWLAFGFQPLVISSEVDINRNGKADHYYIAPIEVNGYTGGMSWSPNGQYLAMVGDSEIKIWDFYTSSLSVSEGVCDTDLSNQNRVSWSPDNTILVAGCAQMDVDYEVENHTNGLQIMRFNTYGQSVEWSTDGSRLAVPYDVGRIHILDANLQLIQTLGEQGNRIKIKDKG